MSREPLPLPEIWSDLPGGEVEPARSEFSGPNGRSSLVFIDYASATAQRQDPQAVIRIPASIPQPATRGHLPSLVPAVLLKGLADLASVAGEAEALLRRPDILKGDVHFAVEHIHDVAMALRMREVEDALCDTLDASVREVGDALVRHEAAATGAVSAAALLRDVIRRLKDLTIVASSLNVAGMEPAAPPSAADADTVTEASEPDVGEANDTTIAGMAAVDVGDAVGINTNVVDTAAMAATTDFLAIGEPVLQAEAVADAASTAACSTEANGEEFTPSQHDGGAASGVDEDESAGRGTAAAATDTVVTAPIHRDQQQQSGQEIHMASAANMGRPAPDPLAVLHGLSEEELIALFS